MLNNEQDA